MASGVDIGVAMRRLSDAMPPPAKVDPDKALQAYVIALAPFETADIEEGIARFLRGDCDPKISLKFYPRPPELGRIVRAVKDEREAADKRKVLETEKAAGKT